MVSIETHSEEHILHNAHIQGQYTHGIKLSLSFAVIGPIICLVLCWFFVYGARAYIRNVINNPNNFPTIAALYWIGQSFTLYVIIMDELTLWEYVNVGLQNDHYHIVLVTRSLEFCFFITYIFIATVLLISHYCPCLPPAVGKQMFKCCYFGIFCGSDISVSEAGLWWCLGGFFPTILCASSHISYIIGGMISHIDNSISIVLFYLFVFIVRFWLFQNAYTFSTKCVRFYHDNKKDYYRSNGCCNIPYHYNSEWTMYSDNIKKSDFNVIALLLMGISVVIIDGFLFYIGYAIFLPSFVSIHVAVDRIYSIGQLVFTFAAFLLTYKLFAGSIGGGNQGIISDKTLKVWRFLNRGTRHYPVESLHLAVKYLLFTALTFERATCTSHEDKREDLRSIREKLTKIRDYYFRDGVFDPTNKPCHMGQVDKCTVHQNQEENLEHFKKENDGKGYQYTKNRLWKAAQSLNWAVGHIVAIPIHEKDITDFRRDIELAKQIITDVEIGTQGYTQLSTNQLKVLHDIVKQLCKGIKHLQKTIRSILQSDEGIPPIYLNSEKISALMAALIFQKTNTSPLSDNEHYSLLMSLIDEELL